MSQQSTDHAQGRYVEYSNDSGSLRYGRDNEGGSESLAETLVIGNVTGGTDIEMSAGDKIVSPAGADIELEPGAGGEVVLDADTTVNGKLTVTGLIDPTGLILEEAPAPSTGATEGAIFVSDGSGGLDQNDLYYRRSSDGAVLNLTAALSAVNYKGTWDANTNTPALGDGGVGGDQGDYYVVSVAGNTSIDGISDWDVGDWIINNGTIWQKVDNTDQVTSVNGQQGAVVLGLPDVLAEDNTTDGNDIEISAGDKIVSPTNEDIELAPAGTGKVILSADTEISGKLSVTGLIDPTGLILDEAAAPNTGAAEGAFFVSDGTGGLVQNDPYYRPGSDGVPVNLLSGGGGGGGLYEETYVTWVAPNQNGAVDDNDLDTPFVTIQGAIDALWSAPIWGSQAPGGIGARTRAQILVASGNYDEEIRIPTAPGTGDVFLIMTAIGPVTLGDAALAYFGSTIPRNITWWNDQTEENLGSGAPGGNNRRPTLVLNAIGGGAGEASSTHTAYSGGWIISGAIFLAGGALPSTTVELHLEHVEVKDQVAKDPTNPHDGILNCYFYRCEMDVFDHSGAYFNVIDSCRFRGTINAGYYGRLTQCFFENDITFVGPSSFPLPPLGWFECAFEKPPNGFGVTVTISGAGLWLVDQVTNRNFEHQIGGGVLALGTLALLDGTLNQAVAFVNPAIATAIDNGSLATPFITIQGAVNAVQNIGGGNVLVSPGNYDETVIIGDSSTVFPVTLKGLGADKGDVVVAPSAANMPGLVISNATLGTLLPWLSNPANYEANYEDLVSSGNTVSGVKIEDISFRGQGISAGWGIVIAGVDSELMSASFSRVSARNTAGQSRGCWCYVGQTFWALCTDLGGMLMVDNSSPDFSHCTVDWLQAWVDCNPVAEYTRFGSNPGILDAINYNSNAGTGVLRMRNCHFAGDVHLNDASRIDIWGGTIETDINCADNCVFNCNNVHTGGNITIGAVGGPLSCPYLGGRYMGVLTDPGGRINRVVGA